MIRQRWFLAVVLTIILGGWIGGAMGDDEPVADSAPTKDASFWMKKKMQYSQAIFEGIATSDFEKIADNGDSMRMLAKIEDFARRRNPGYDTQLRIFQAATRDLITQADNENIEGATLAFTQLTISCVKCHKQLRDEPKPQTEDAP